MNSSSLIQSLNSAYIEPLDTTEESTILKAANTHWFSIDEYRKLTSQLPEGTDEATLLEFIWESGPGLSWVGWYGLIRSEPDSGFITEYMEDEEDDNVYVVAKITPVNAAALKLLFSNYASGKIQGPFGGERPRYPDQVNNYEPELIPDATEKLICDAIFRSA